MEKQKKIVGMRIYFSEQYADISMNVFEEDYYKPLFRCIYNHICSEQNSTTDWDNYIMKVANILRYHGIEEFSVSNIYTTESLTKNICAK